MHGSARRQFYELFKQTFQTVNLSNLFLFYYSFIYNSFKKFDTKFSVKKH